MSVEYMVLGFEPRPLEHESPPITTRPGLPSKDCFVNVAKCKHYSKALTYHPLQAPIGFCMEAACTIVFNFLEL